MLSRFWLLKVQEGGGGGGGLGQFVKKGKFEKNVFQVLLNEVLKICEI